MGALSPILRGLEGGRIAFRCPGCGMPHQVRVEGDAPGPRWTWDGNAAAPTISPSILVSWTHGEANEPRRCHSFVRGGRIEFLADCTHALAGQTVPIPPWDEGASR